MVELNDKALEAAVVTYRGGLRVGLDERERRGVVIDIVTSYLSALPEEVVFCPQCGWNSAMDGEALPAPDDGLAAKLILFADRLFPAVLEYGREIALLREAATAIQSKDEQIERLTEERDAAQAEAKKWWLECCQALQDKNAAEASEQHVQKHTAENERLREIVSECAGALPNGAFISPSASIEFMAKLPAEIRSVCSALETEAEK